MRKSKSRRRLATDDWSGTVRRTKYAGVWFRSRLESLWARTFDAAGVRWAYEPTRFYFGNQSYLPDFHLPDYGLFVEVKPVGPSVMEFWLAQTLHEQLGGGVGAGFLIGKPPGVFLQGRIERLDGAGGPAVLFYAEPLPWEVNR